MKKGGFAGNCHYCGQGMFQHGSADVRANKWCQVTKDHVVPKSLKLVPETMRQRTVLSCMACNTIKHDAPYEIFRWWRKQHLKGDPNALRAQFRAFVSYLTLAGFSAAWRTARPVCEAEKPAIRWHSAPKSMADVLARFRA
jgi:hypothetical protein